MVLGRRAAQPGQVDLRRRVMQDVILPRHPSEPHAQGHKPRVLAAEGQRLPVLFAVEEQVPLIAFEHWPRDLDGFAQAVFIGPLDEEADVNETVLHRELGVAAHPERVQMLVHQQFHRRPGRGLGLAGFGYAGHALPPVLPLPLPLGCAWVRLRREFAERRWPRPPYLCVFRAIYRKNRLPPASLLAISHS